MTPILLYTLIAAGLGWSIHKKMWGIAVFCGAMLVWMLVMQLIIAISMHPISF
jgi:hypothetical protein